MKRIIVLMLSLVTTVLFGITAFAATGQWEKDSNGWMFSYAQGGYAKETWEKINGKWYYFDGTGHIVTGWKNAGNNWYYLSPSTGTIQTGWVKYEGKYYYLNPSTGALQTGWVKYGGKYYYLNPSTGALQTGWVKYGGKYYYLSPSTGTLLTGWIKYRNTWYYMDPTTGAFLKVHEHDYRAKVTTAATCISEGIKTYTCACGDSYTEIIPKTEHEWEVVTNYFRVHYMPPHYVCNICLFGFEDIFDLTDYFIICGHGGYHVDDYIVDYFEYLGNDYSEPNETNVFSIFAGCRCKNCKGFRCAHRDESSYLYIVDEAITYGNVPVEVPAEHTYSYYSDNHIHTGEVEIVKPCTCLEKGEMKIVCETCGLVKTNTYGGNGHIIVPVSSELVEVNVGTSLYRYYHLVEFECRNCGEKVTFTLYPHEGEHTFINGICTLCGEYE